MRKFIYIAVVAATGFVAMQACKKSGSDDGGKNGSSFDRKAMLTNLETNIILPSLATFQTNVTALDAATVAFNAAPDATKLTALQTAFKTAYIQWQSVSEYGFGPAEPINYRVSMNTYPASVTQINSNVDAGVYQADLLTNLAAKGFPALDYLLFGTGADNTAILAQYTTDAKAGNRKDYIAKLTAEMKTNTNTVVSAWNSTYKTTFLNADGTDVGSSAGQLINQLVYDYELLKNYEIGVPAGIQSMGTTHPEKIQAYYSKISVQLATAHLQAIQNLYLGKTTAGDGLGLDDFLTQGAANNNGATVNTNIKNQITAALAKLQALTDPLSTQIQTNNTAVTATYTELQKLTVLLKTDMTSSLGILITYGDNDGD